MEYRQGFNPSPCPNDIPDLHCDFQAEMYEARAKAYQQFAKKLSTILGKKWNIRLEQVAEQGLLASRSPMFLALKQKGAQFIIVPLTVNTRGNQIVVLKPNSQPTKIKFRDISRLADYLEKASLKKML